MIIKENLQRRISDEITLLKDEGITDEDTIIRNVLLSLDLSPSRYKYVKEILSYHNYYYNNIEEIEEFSIPEKDNISDPKKIGIYEKDKNVASINNYFYNYCKKSNIEIYSDGRINALKGGNQNIKRVIKAFEKKNQDYILIIDQEIVDGRPCYYYKGVRRRCQ